jgi:glycopeptide antibiotics resistance protein
VWGTTLLRALALVAALVTLTPFSFARAKMTLTPSPASEDHVRSNLRPGRSLRQYAEDYLPPACKQAGGILLLGVPFGILLPILVPRRLRMLRMDLLTVTAMVAIELVQGALVTGRAFDIDDVILNATGALLGHLLVGRRISHRYHVLAERTTRAEAAAEPKAEPGAEPKPKRKSAPRSEPKSTSTSESKPKSKPKARSRAATGRSASGLVGALLGRLLTRDR